MAVQKPLLTEFDIHHNFDSCKCVAMKGKARCAKPLPTYDIPFIINVLRFDNPKVQDLQQFSHIPHS